MPEVRKGDSEEREMRLINADELIAKYRDSGISTRVDNFVELIEDTQTIDAIPIGCLELEKRDCGFADQCDMGSSYGRERERACKNIIDWWKTPSYQKCLDVATERGFVKKKWSLD